jgi:hypothetical protein
MMKKIPLLILFVIWFPNSAFSQEENFPAESKETIETEIHPQVKEYFVDVLLPHLWEGTKAVFSEDTFQYWALASFTAGIAFSQDEDVRDYWLEHDLIGDWKVVGNFYGEGYTQAGLALSFWGLGAITKDQKLASTGEVLIEAEILNGLVTTAMKQVIGRERPDNSGNDSFPSGHTSDSFCFAAVIDERYGHAWGIPAYALATLTALSRMESDKHWLSDVVMGAGTGMIIGYSVSKNHDDYPYEKRWHHTDKNLIQQAHILPVFPQNQKDEFGFRIYITLD